MMTHFLVLSAAVGIDDETEDQVAELIGVAAHRLGDCAVEFAVPADVEIPRIAGIDINLVPVTNRRKKLLIADMDSTMINVECIDELADFAGVKTQVSEITERAMLGDLDFDGALRERVALLKDLPESALAECYEQRIHLNPGAETLVKTMNKRGAFTALVSGGFTYFTDKVATEAGFQLHQANILLRENGTLTGEVGAPILGQQAKLDTLNRLCAEQGITLADTIAVGDGANDRAMIKAAGLGVAYHAKPTLIAAADARLDHSDLTALLALQGISENDYA